MKEAMPEDYQSYSELIFCAGFFLLYLIDEVVIDILPVAKIHTGHARRQKINLSSVISKHIVDLKAPGQLACHVGHQEPCHAAPTAAVGLLAALSAHALLEGLAVGLEPSASKVLLLLGAISSHKLVVGFCLGVELVSDAATSFCKHFMYILIFALGSVAGIVTGMLISNIPEEVSKFVIPVCQVR
nr:unnamed protein product [Callosobruchus analis]